MPSAVLEDWPVRIPRLRADCGNTDGRSSVFSMTARCRWHAADRVPLTFRQPHASRQGLQAATGRLSPGKTPPVRPRHLHADARHPARMPLSLSLAALRPLFPGVFP